VTSKTPTILNVLLATQLQRPYLCHVIVIKFICKQRFIYVLALWVATVVCLKAQLSPGELTQAHAHLEGVRNCTQCHTVGQKVSNDKCLQCHHDVKWRVEKAHGYHGSKEVQGKDCFSCHSDHHGRKFEPVRWDTKQFDHNLTGYQLTGKHAQIDCRSCHKPDLVQDQHLKKLPDTYFGLRQDCATCHQDPHQGTLKNNCTQCHTNDAFKPAARFNHATADFQLKGKHAQVACAECHKTEQRNGKAMQQFDGVAFSKCTSCHQDPHASALPGDCASCHNESGWAQFDGRKRFNHDLTDFDLKGAHKALDCRSCHQMDGAAVTAKKVFQDKKQVAQNQCITCHKDPHESKFGTDCAACHSESAWNKVRFDKSFNHAVTGFALDGKHATVDCKKCHTTGSMTTPVAHASCNACHGDFHKGVFAGGEKNRNQKPLDCAACHTVQGFAPSTFDEAQHANTAFALKGGHISTPCVACHMREGAKAWQFRNIGQKCNDCHQDVHEGSITAKYYPNHDCTVCHSSETWLEPQFAHEKTGFVLETSHSAQACAKCHIRDVTFAFGKFSGTATTCAACHDDIHQGQFATKGSAAKVVQCNDCHVANGWQPVLFNHQNTRFPLEGKHAVIACSICHQPEHKTGDGFAYVHYKNGRLECRDCHK
jgi:hypothetical protein